MHDHRRKKRYDAFHIVEFKPLKRKNGHVIGITRNLSSEGFSMESQTFEFEKGEVLECKIKHSSSDVVVNVQGEVVWKEQAWYKYIVGVKFYDLTEKTKKELQELISTLKELSDEDMQEEVPESVAEEPELEAPAAKSGTGKLDGMIMDMSGISSSDDEPSTPEPDEPVVVFKKDEPAERVPAPSAPVNEEAEQEAAFDVNGKVRETIQWQESVHAHSDKAASIERKKKVWIYVPILTIIAVVIVMALPVMIKNFSNGSNKSRIDNPDLVPKKMVEERGSANAGDKGDGSSPKKVLDGEHAAKPGIKKEKSKDDTARVSGNEAGSQEEQKIDLLAQIDEIMKKTKAIEDVKPEPVNVVPKPAVKKFAQPVKTAPDKTVPEIEPVVKAESLKKKKAPVKTASTVKAESEPLKKDVKASQVVEIKEPASKEPPVKKKKALVRKKKVKTVAKEKSKPVEVVKVEPVKKSPAPKEPVIKKEQNPSDVKSAGGNKTAAKAETTAKKSAVVEAKDSEPDSQAKKLVSETSKKEHTEKADKVDKSAKAKPAVKAESTTIKTPPVTKEALSEAKTEPQGRPVKPEPETQLIAKTEAPEKVETSEIPEVKKEEPVKESPSVKTKKLPKIALLVKSGSLMKKLNLSKTKKKTAESIVWKSIGKTGDGVPLFIDPASVKHPSESSVQMLMKASVNKKDFIDLVEINCSGNKLRIVEARTGKNPVLSAYSSEWRNILLESAAIYNSACLTKK